MRVNSKPKKEVTTSTSKPKIHNVIILDSSSSMHGSKYQSAQLGIIEEFKALNNDTNAEYTHTLVEFGTLLYSHFTMIPNPTSALIQWKNAQMGMTALYDAIGHTLQEIKSKVKDGEKVLVKIFTDGQENVSRWFTAKTIAELIKDVEGRGFTITFEGTKFDTDTIIRTIGISSTNVHVHDNTAEGITRGVKARIQSTMFYSKAVADGEDVTIGFYSKLAE